ncbi:MAG: hypothetical protein NTY33_02425, partial [Candidatus Moranbacteria bacterium]|nr:hypothetical protein [Candidatus Moranbacteria bacterium]
VLADRMMTAATGAAGGLKLSADGGTLSSSVSSISFFAIPLVILWIGIERAQSSGIAGASMVVGAGTKFMSWTGKTLSGYRAGRWVATKAVPAVTKAGLEKFEETVLAPIGLSPAAIKKGRTDRAKKNRDKAINPAVGAVHDKLNKFFDGEKTNYKQLEMERLDAIRLKELKEISTHSGILLSNGVGLIGSGSPSASRDWRAIAKILVSQRDQDDFMHYLRTHLDDKILAGGKSLRDIGIGINEKGEFDASLLGVSGWNVNQAIEKILKACGDTDEEINKFVLDVDEISGANKSIGYGGIIVDKNGKLVKAKNKWQQARAAIAKLSTAGDTQAIAKETHRNYITGEGIDPSTGFTIINAEFAEMVRAGIPGIIKSQVNRHAPTFYQQVDSEDTLKGMRFELDRLRDDPTYLNYWDDNADDGKGGKGVLVNKRITPEQHEQTAQWISAQEIYTKTGKATAGKQADLDEMNKALRSTP